MNRYQRNGTGLKLSTSKYCDQPETLAWDDVIPIPRLSFSQAVCIIFCLAILCFANSYDGDFVFDDSEAVTGNKDLKPQTPLADLFFHDFWGRKLDSKTSHKSYRPLTVLTFRWNYLLAGGLYPIGFHIMNIILHGVVSVLVLVTCSVLLSGCEIRNGSHVFGCPKASFLCAILFAVHPVHTESVAAVVGRADLMCAMFFILSFLFYIKACLKGLTDGRLHQPAKVSWVWLVASMFLCCASVLCKEQGITVIGICCAYDVISICQIDLLAVPGSIFKPKKVQDTDSKQAYTKPWQRYLACRLLFLLISGLIILTVRWRMMGSATPTFQVFDNPHSFVNGSLYRAINYIYLYSINCWLLIHPWWLCFDWSMGCIPVIESLSDWRIPFVILFLLVVSGLLHTSLCGTFSYPKRIITMALAFIIVPFLPAMNIFFRVGFVIAERVLYLPSIGFCILVVTGVSNLCQNKERREVVRYCMYYLVVIFMLRSIHRSDQWRQEMPLFLSGAKVCPLNAKVHYNIAKLNGDSGNTEVAIEKYRLAIRLNSEYDQAMNNLGNILKEKGKLQEAEQLLLKAVKIRDDFAAAWMNLGIVQAALHKNSSAEISYYTAIKHRRRYPDCYYNLGNLYLEMGKHHLAIQAFKNATQQKPDHVNAWGNMVILMDNLGYTSEAERFGREALQYSKDPTLLLNLANILGKQDKFQESEKYFLEAVKGKNDDPRTFSNLGVLYHRWGKYDSAVKAYNKALELDSSLTTTRDNLNMVLRKMERMRT